MKNSGEPFEANTVFYESKRKRGALPRAERSTTSSGELDAGLFLDALQGANRYGLATRRNFHMVLSTWLSKDSVSAVLPYLSKALLFQHRDDLP